MTITRTKKKKALPLVPLWLGAGLALALVALGAPMLAGRLYLAPADGARAALLEGKPLQEAQAVAFEKTRLGVSAWFPDAAVTNDLAMLAFDRATSLRDPAQRELFLKDAEYWQRRALSRAPADAYGWLRLAYLYQDLDGVSSRAANALRLSLAMAAYEPRLLTARVQMILKNTALMDADTKRRLPMMLRDAFRLDEEALVRAAAKDGFVGDLEAALAGDAESLEKLAQDLAALRSEPR